MLKPIETSGDSEGNDDVPALNLTSMDEEGDDDLNAFMDEFELNTQGESFRRPLRKAE